MWEKRLEAKSRIVMEKWAHIAFNFVVPAFTYQFFLYCPVLRGIILESLIQMFRLFFFPSRYNFRKLNKKHNQVWALGKNFGLKNSDLKTIFFLKSWVLGDSILSEGLNVILVIC